MHSRVLQQGSVSAERPAANLEPCIGDCAFDVQLLRLQREWLQEEDAAQSRSCVNKARYCSRHFKVSGAREDDVATHDMIGNDGVQHMMRELTAVSPTCVTSLDLRHNDLTELPLELTRLDRLETLEIDAGNPGLGTATQILQDGGVQDLFDYVRELHDDPRPSYSLKVVLAGPSMAGKSSLLNALRMREAQLTDPEHGRTIGLDIERIELYDPRAGKHVVVFLAYDAGGHVEYQEMHQSFFSDHTLYILVWNVALTNDVEMQEAQAAWASLIQTCAPGSKVLLVASHADKVEDVAVVERRCNEMTRAVHVLLDQHRQ